MTEKLEYPVELKYTETHEWVRIDDDTAKLGITAFATTSLSDITFVQFDAEVGDELSKGETFGEVESVKTTSDLYMPVSGKVIAVNAELEESGDLDELMKDPYEFGWMLEIELTDPDEIKELLSVSEYEKHTQTVQH